MMYGTAIGYLHFMNPMWAWAMPAAVGVPLLAHLLAERGGKRMVFPTVRFVQRATAHQARWLRPRHWLLLVLRSAVLTLIVVAFARPVWFGDGLPSQSRKTILTVLVLDRSASMNRTYHGTTLFDEARRQVVQALRRMDPAGDIATVILLDAAPEQLLPEPSSNFEQLIRLTEQTRPTDQRGNLDAALRLARDQVARVTAGGIPLAWGNAVADPHSVQVRIDLFSDMQKTQFSDWSTPPASQDTVSLHWHPIGIAVPNLALLKPTVSPAEPVVSQPTTVTVDVAYFGTNRSSDWVTVRLKFEGKDQVRSVRMAAGTTQTVAFMIEPSRAGPASIDVQLQYREPFELDNRTGLCFTVHPARRVALVSAADPDDPQAATYYFVRALAPATLDHGGTGVDLAVWHPDRIDQQLTDRGWDSRPAAIVMVEAGGLVASSLSVLHHYLTDGGAVIWIVDSPQAAQALHQFSRLDPQASPIVPHRVSSWVTGVDLTLASGRFDDPILQVFEGPARGGLMEMSFSAVMAGSTVPSAVILLRYSDGTPAITSRWSGAGRLAVFGADLSPSHSNVVKGPLFVPLLHQLVRHLVPGPAVSRSTYPGARCVVVIGHDDAIATLIARGPDGQTAPLVARPAGRSRVAIELGPVARLGRYTVGRADNEVILGGVYVRLDPAESDLRVLEQSVTVDRFGSSGSHASGAGLRRTTRSQSGVESLVLWPYLVCAAVLIAVLESVLAALARGFGGEGSDRAIKESTIRVSVGR